MNKKRTLGIILIVLFFLSVGIFIFLKGKSNPNQKIGKQVQGYQVEGVDNIFLNGKIEPKESQTIIEDPTLGRVETIHVSSGGNIIKGNPVITYINQEVANQITDIEGTISDMRTQKANLIKQGSKMTEEGQANLPVDTSEIDNQIKSNERQLTTLRGRLRTTVNAEINGIVTIKEGGSQASQEIKGTGREFYIESQTYVLKGTVGERDILKVEEGLKADITFKAIKETKTGTVITVAKTPTTGGEKNEDPYSMGGTETSYDVIIELDNQDNILSGFSCQAKINRNIGPLEVPKEAVLEIKGKNKIYSIEEGVIKILDVEVGENAKDKIEIKTDISGKVIVLSPTKDLKEGEQVEYVIN